MATEQKVASIKDEFRLLLNGNEDVRAELEEFKKVCSEHEKHRVRSCKRRYYQLGLMARIVCETTFDELRSLLANGTSTFLVDLVRNKPEHVSDMVNRIKEAIGELQNGEPLKRVVIGLAFEINGDGLRLGRLRNNCSIMMNRGDVISLSINEAYRWCGFKEISFVINLKFYMNRIGLGDQIKIGSQVVGHVVKCLKTNVALVIELPGIINSFDFIEMPDHCYAHPPDDLSSMFVEDVKRIAKLGGDYIVIPGIRHKPFLRALRHHLESDHENASYKMIGSIDLEYVTSKMIDLLGIIKTLDYIWIPDMFKASSSVQTYLYEEFIPMVKCLKKPIIGTVPLQRCSEFKNYESHDFLWKIDAIFIEKSSWCLKYPLIVKKMLPIRDFHHAVLDNSMPIKGVLTTYESIVNFVVRTISTIECQAIFIFSRCESAAEAFSGIHVYCPVYVMLPLEKETIDEKDYENDLKRKMEMARSYNLRRNLRPVIFTPDMNDCDFTPIDYGINMARTYGCVSTGDFVVTVEVCKDMEDVDIGGTDNMCVLRAFYMPPLPFTEKFMYS